MFPWLKRPFRWPPGFLEDPGGPSSSAPDDLNGVRHPKVLRPGGRNAAVEVDEPDESLELSAVGSSATHWPRR
jgi:hypothetical protein